MTSAFQSSAFQQTAFQTGETITGLGVLQLPVDYQLAGQPPYRDVKGTMETFPPQNEEHTIVRRSSARRLGGRASYTVTTNSKGYK